MESLIERMDHASLEHNLMKRYNVFASTEIDKICKDRRDFEERLSKNPDDVNIFMEYIDYEKQLLRRILAARKGPRTQRTNTELEDSLGYRVLRIYRAAVNEFPTNLSMWNMYLKHCQTTRYDAEVDSILDRMVQHLADYPAIWQNAALVAYSRNDLPKCRSLFVEAFNLHPSDKELFKSFFEIELKEECVNKGEVNSIGKPAAEVLWDNARKNIFDVKFAVEMLEICEKYDGTDRYQSIILDHMVHDFANVPLMYHTLAQREIRGFHMNNSFRNKPFNTPVLVPTTVEAATAAINGTDSDDDEVSKQRARRPNEKRLIKDRMLLGSMIYHRAIEATNTPEMWKYYVDAMMLANKDENLPKQFRRKILGRCLEKAFESEMMCSENYSDYLEILIDQGAKPDNMLKVIEKGVQQNPGSVELWDLKMRYHIARDEEEDIVDVFRRACKKLAFKSKPLWSLILLYYQTKPDLSIEHSNVDRYFKEAVNYHESAAFCEFRTQYVEWAAATRSLRYARQVYKEMSNLKPYYLELHQRMSLIESMQMKPCIDAWRMVHKNTVDQFGHNNINVWMDFIKFERDSSNEPKNMGRVFEIAKKTLNEFCPEKLDTFISTYNLAVSLKN